MPDCLREARRALVEQKPLTLVFDPVRGGASLEVIQRDECPDDLRAPIFDGREVIHWHRVKVRPAAALSLAPTSPSRSAATLLTRPRGARRTSSW